ncbi:MAG: hypothetical protein JST21_06270 [Bacteroidetes bacterium]|nr:hypothetical protein [Bacteroidota bacterium]
MAEITQQQIDDWKKKHGEIFQIEVDGHVAFLKTPDRKTLSYAGSVGTKDPIKFNEILLNNCWLGGDEEIKTDDSLFLGAGQVISEIIKVKEATIKKI